MALPFLMICFAAGLFVEVVVILRPSLKAEDDRNFPVVLPLLPEYWGYRHVPPLLVMWFWGLNAGFHVCKASTIPSELCSQPNL